MSDALERIWIDLKSVGTSGDVYDTPPDHDLQAAQTEYVRADLYAKQAERIAGLQEAIDYYEIGISAVGVHHERERKVLRECVERARAIRAALEGN